MKDGKNSYFYDVSGLDFLRVEIIYSFFAYGGYRDLAEKVNRGAEKMKTIITVDIADIIAAIILGLLICLFMRAQNLAHLTQAPRLSRRHCQRYRRTQPRSRPSLSRLQLFRPHAGIHGRQLRMTLPCRSHSRSVNCLELMKAG